MTLHIESGHPVTADVEPVKGKFVRFVTDSGRTMFEVWIGGDGRSLEVRGVETTKHGEEIYDRWLQVHPNAANSITVRTVKYGS